MKRLTLMRHGDARWKDAGLSDLERPLNRRGSAAAETMARRLLELELVPDLMLVSPARRTQQTAEIVARELSIPARRVVREERLYLAAMGDLLQVVRDTGPRISHLLLIAHNPGISELAGLLVPKGTQAGLASAAVCSIAFEAEDWNALGPECVKQVHQESPPGRLFGLFA
ncbi:MAG: histidine phosphatase family protein [Gammaproteobacteria bacterium]|nr:histidine phosphatase family protein [Gammaproteobacteria bacterium]